MKTDEAPLDEALHDVEYVIGRLRLTQRLLDSLHESHTRHVLDAAKAMDENLMLSDEDYLALRDLLAAAAEENIKRMKSYVRDRSSRLASLLFESETSGDTLSPNATPAEPVING